MMMKKKLAALLLAAASAMVFTGCGSSDNQTKKCRLNIGM